MCFRNEFATKATKLTGYFAMALFDALLAGCTSVEEGSVDAGLHLIYHFCIKETPRVKVADFVYIMRTYSRNMGFLRKYSTALHPTIANT